MPTKTAFSSGATARIGTFRKFGLTLLLLQMPAQAVRPSSGVTTTQIMQKSSQTLLDEQNTANHVGEGSRLVSKRRTPVASPSPSLTMRGNPVLAVQAETLWAVRALRHSTDRNDKVGQHETLPRKHDDAESNASPCFAIPAAWGEGPVTNMDLLWAWILAIQKNDRSGIPFRLNPPMDEEGNLRNQEPTRMLAAIHVGHSFKNGVDEYGRGVFGMDYYVNDRIMRAEEVQCVLEPDGQKNSMQNRHLAVRSKPFFKRRGRKGFGEASPAEQERLQSRWELSGSNPHAGIAPLEHMPDEALDFFPHPIQHGGKSGNVRNNTAGTMAHTFSRRGMPFIGGASGSIEYLIHSMEDDCAGSCPDGLVPVGLLDLREALIGIMTAALVAGGQHSIGECMVVAQAMGYFTELPLVMQTDSHAAYMELFARKMESLGIFAPPPVSNTASL